MVPKQTDGIVIHVTDYGESDTIVTLYSPTAGKFNGIAKGAKRSKIRFVNKLEPFSLLSIQYSDKYALPLIEQADLIESHLSLRHHFPSFAAATLLCELIRHWCPEHEGDEELFASLSWALSALSSTTIPKQVLILFLTKFYGLLGYQPEFNCCSRCSTLTPQTVPFSFLVDQGAVLCRKCSVERSPMVPLSLTTLKLLAKATELPIGKLSRLKFNSREIGEAIHLFRHYDRYLLDKEIQAWNFLDP